MSGNDEDRRSPRDKAMRSADAAKQLDKLDRNIKEQLKFDKIDDCQKSPSRFARFCICRPISPPCELLL